MTWQVSMEQPGEGTLGPTTHANSQELATPEPLLTAWSLETARDGGSSAPRASWRPAGVFAPQPAKLFCPARCCCWS